MELENWVKAAAQLSKWYREGKNIPYYEYANFHPWLAKMLGVSHIISRKFDEEHDKLYQSICGPHGWTIIQMLIVQYRERLNVKWNLTNEQKRKEKAKFKAKIRNKKARQRHQMARDA